MKMTQVRNVFRAALAVSLAGIPLAAANADVTANIGASTNYVWRGVTQTNDKPAVSGGLDFSSDSGVYIGVWSSTVDFDNPGYEFDAYMGYSNSIGNADFDFGVIHYAYPLHDESDFTEFVASGSFAGIGLTVNQLLDAEFTDDPYTYFNLAYSIPITGDFELSVYGGSYRFDDQANDYSHYGISVSKTLFSIAVEKNNGRAGLDDSVRVSVGATYEF